MNKQFSSIMTPEERASYADQIIFDKLVRLQRVLFEDYRYKHILHAREGMTMNEMNVFWQDIQESVAPSPEPTFPVVEADDDGHQWVLMWATPTQEEENQDDD